MTIRVCRNKFYERAERCLSLFGLLLESVVQFAFPAMFGFGIYLIIIGFPLGFFFVFLGGFLSLVVFVMIFLHERETVFQKLNKKLHLFAWDRDC